MWLNIKSKLFTTWYLLTFRFKNNKIKPLTDIVFKESFKFSTFFKRWSNGWYVNNGGNDDRKRYDFHSLNIGINETEKKLLLLSKPSKDKSGCMIYSKKTFLYGIFRFELNLSSFDSEEFAFWLKSYETDVNEVDNLEIFMDGKRKHKLLFTAHTGTAYFGEGNHKIFSSSLRKFIRHSESTMFDLHWEKDKLTWYVNGNPVKVWFGKTPEVPMGIIINYGKTEYNRYNSLATIRNIVVAKNYSNEDI